MQNPVELADTSGNTQDIMASVNLNMDALSATCQFLTDVSDLLSFSLTCSSLRPVATQRLISISPIRLTKGALIHKLHSFLFADAPARTPYVRTVQIVWGSEAHHQQTPDGEVCLLMHILSSCPNLDSMRVYLSKSAHLSPSPGNRCIIEAIGTLRNLRELTMHGWPWDAHALLCAIRTPLRVLRIQSDDHICLSVTCWYPTKLKYFLLHLMPTLEQLELSAFTVDPSLSRSGIPLEPLSTLPQYPSVRSLTIGYFIGRLLLDRLQHIFPSLDGALSIQNYHTTYTDTHAALNSARRNNEDSTWRKLDRLVCTPEVFYRIVVSLCCPIRLVMLRQVCIDTLRFVIEGLRANPVPRLQLELELLGRGFYVLHRGLFRPELAGTLTHLTLVFKYTKQPVCALAEAGPDPHPLAQLQWHHVYNATLAALEPLHALTHLRLVVSTYICRILPSLPAPSNPFVHTVHGTTFDFAGTAAALLSRVPLHPSLQYLLIQTDGRLLYHVGLPRLRTVEEKWHAAQGWRIARTCEKHAPAADGMGTRGGEPVLVELAEAVVKTIVWREELFASEAEEEWLKRGCV